MLADKSQHGFLLRGSTQQLTQTDTDTYSLTVDGAWGLLWKIRRKGYRVLKGIGTPQEDLQSHLTWTLGVLKVNHQPKNIHGLQLGLPVHM